MQHKVQDSALNHNLVVHIAYEKASWSPPLRYEYLWNHSYSIQMWRVMDGSQTRSVRTFGFRELMAVIPLAHRGESPTLDDARFQAKAHADANLPALTEAIRTHLGVGSREQY